MQAFGCVSFCNKNKALKKCVLNSDPDWNKKYCGLTSIQSLYPVNIHLFSFVQKNCKVATVFPIDLLNLFFVFRLIEDNFKARIH